MDLERDKSGEKRSDQRSRWASWLATAMGLVLLIAFVVLGAGRWLLGRAVETADFRMFVAGSCEMALRGLLPSGIVEVGRARLRGLATLELSRVTVRSGRHLDSSLDLGDVELSVDWQRLSQPASLEALSSDRALPWRATLARVGGDGWLDLRGSWPVASPTSPETAAMVNAFGEVGHLDMGPLLALYSAEHPGAALPLGRGYLSGRFDLAKPLPHVHGGEKAGHAQFVLVDSRWQPPGQPGSVPKASDVVTFAEMRLGLAMSDYELRLLSPIVAPVRAGDHQGEVTIAGTLTLPKYADHLPKWGLNVAVRETTQPKGLSRALQRLLRCADSPVDADRFAVIGSVQHPECPQP